MSPSAAGGGGGQPAIVAPPIVNRSTLKLTNDILANGADEWLTEARLRFEDPFIVSIHGNAEEESRWRLVGGGAGDAEFLPLMDANTLAWTLHLLMPGRDIVFVACNPNRLRLTESGRSSLEGWRR